MKKFDRVDWIVILAAALLLYLFFPKGSPAPAPGTAGAPAGQSPAAPPSAEANASTPAAAATNPTVPPAVTVAKEEVTLKNAAAEFTFTNLGGGIQRAKLLAAPFAGKTVQELNERGRAGSSAPVGSLAKGVGELDTTPWDKVAETPTSISYRKDANGLEITKLWTMKPGADPQKGPGYLWDLQISLKNKGAEKVVSGEHYLFTGSSTQLHKQDALYVSGAYLADGKSLQVMRGDFDQQKRLWVLWETQPARAVVEHTYGKLSWAGTVSQYYASLVNPVLAPNAPPADTAGKLWIKYFDDKGLITQEGPVAGAVGMEAGVGLGNLSLEPGAEKVLNFEVYMGPRSATLLSNTGSERTEAMFYGFTGFLSRIFLWLLNWFNAKTASFGIAIVLLTIVVRTVIWPLTIKSTRAMKRMSKLSPMMSEIKEKYKGRPQTPDNARAQQMEMMGLYREYKVSPLGGCLPLLLQMPIFFGYFGMLNHAVEMRGHSFLWAKDLTTPDTVFTLFGFLPVNPLPLLMTATMYLQMKLTPMQQPAMSGGNDAMAQQMALQMKMFKFMPLLFLFFCYGNASALALYWTVQNIVSIIQTYAMKLLPEPELEKRAVRQAPPGGGFSPFGNSKAPRDKGPREPRAGGGGKSAFKS